MNEKKLPQIGDIWIIDYNYKPEKGNISSSEMESRIKKFRPSLVISNNSQNEFDVEIVVAPLSTQELKTIEPFEVFLLANKENGLEKDSKVMLNYLRSIEKETRLKEYCGRISEREIWQVKRSLKIVLDLE